MRERVKTSEARARANARGVVVAAVPLHHDREERAVSAATWALRASSPQPQVVLQPTRATRTCKRVGAQILSLGSAFGGLAGGFEGAGAAAQEEGERPGPWLWQGWPRGAAAARGRPPCQPA